MCKRRQRIHKIDRKIETIYSQDEMITNNYKGRRGGAGGGVFTHLHILKVCSHPKVS